MFAFLFLLFSSLLSSATVCVSQRTYKKAHYCSYFLVHMVSHSFLFSPCRKYMCRYTQTSFPGTVDEYVKVHLCNLALIEILRTFSWAVRVSLSWFHSGLHLLGTYRNPATWFLSSFFQSAKRLDCVGERLQSMMNILERWKELRLTWFHLTPNTEHT